MKRRRSDRNISRMATSAIPSTIYRIQMLDSVMRSALLMYVSPNSSVYLPTHPFAHHSTYPSPIPSIHILTTFLTTPPQDRTLLRKLDLALIPWLSFLYLISFLDRTNIGNAKVDGLQEDLGMSNGQYNETLTIFFISYSVFEPLTNVLLKKLRPSVFLPIIMVWW
jgi:hypothetical protein